jgi:large subunit ribosomal protein L10
MGKKPFFILLQRGDIMPSAKILEAKKQAVEEIKAQLSKAVSGVFVDYCGLTVEQDTKLRNKLREANVEYKVVKNTLTRFAAKEVGLEGLDEILEGPTALAIADDEVTAAKVLADFAKDNEQLEIKSGFLDGKVVSVDEVKKLADTPSRDVLLAKMMGSMQSPISALARTLQALVDNGVEPADIKVEKAEAPAEEAAAE